MEKVAPKTTTRPQIESFWDRFWWVFVKGYHALEYAILFSLLAWAFRPTGRGWAYIWLFCVSYAASDEFHQTFVPHRGGRWTDVVIDSGGAAFTGLAFFIGYRIVALRRK